MILLAALVLSCVIALVRGGRFSYLENWRPRLGGMAVLALLMQVMEVVFQPQPSWVGQTLIVASIVLLLWFAVANWTLPGFPILVLGVVLNTLAMVANGGRMPVSAAALERAGLVQLASLPEGTLLEGSKDVLLDPTSVSLLWLCDVLPVPPPISVVLSVGDLLVAAGGAWYWQRALFDRNDANSRSVADVTG